MLINIFITITSLLAILHIYIVLYVVPIEITQGFIQKIFYYHVPIAWVSFISFTIALYHNIQYLRSQNLNNYYKAYSHTFIGWLFTSGVLITGPLWAKPIWGSYWNWADERLITFFILWLSYGTYILINKALFSLQQKANVSSILGIISFINVPIVYLAIRIWETPSHPGPIISKNSNSLSPEMHFTIWYSTIACFCIYLVLYLIYSKYLQQKHTLKYLLNSSH